jgi:hypothetical protein
MHQGTSGGAVSPPDLARSSWGVADWPLALGAGGPQAGFSTPSPQVCTKGLSPKKNRFRGLPAPPGGPPVLGSLVRSAEGLPSTRNWPFRWPLSPTSPPQVIPKAM